MTTTSRKTRTAASLLATVGVVVGLSAAPAAADTQMTTSAGVNVRSGPSASTKIIGSLYRGQTVTVIGTTNGWAKVRFKEQAAYVASRYLIKGGTLSAPSSAASAVRVTTTDLNLREGPGLSYRVITVLDKGTVVTLTGKAARGYAEVSVAGHQGWASRQYLTSTGSGLPKIIGVRVATADLLIRTTSGSDYKVVGEVTKGTKLSVTGTTQNGRAQIVYRDAVRWVTARYLGNLSTTLPAPPPLPRVTGYRYATTALLIRSTYSNTFTTVTEVPTGTKLAITGVVRNGRAQVVYNGAARWVTAKYLSTTAPPPSSTKYAVEKGLKPNAIKLHREVRRLFPQITTIYGVRRDPIPDHPSGRALDLMIPNYKSASGKALGGRVASWARTNAKALGIEYVIWDQRIWNIRRDKEGWRYMANRGGDSANHKNHIHITVFG